MLPLSPLPDYQEGQNATEPFRTSQDDGNWTLLECPPGFQWCHLTDLCSSANNCCNATECTNSSLASSPAFLQHNESQPSYQLIKEFLFTVPAGPSSPYLVSVYYCCTSWGGGEVALGALCKVRIVPGLRMEKLKSIQMK